MVIGVYVNVIPSAVYHLNKTYLRKVISLSLFLVLVSLPCLSFKSLSTQGDSI